VPYALGLGVALLQRAEVEAFPAACSALLAGSAGLYLWAGGALRAGSKIELVESLLRTGRMGLRALRTILVLACMVVVWTDLLHSVM
jgi:hypothetical protein